jgi:hypothetical protein
VAYDLLNKTTSGRDFALGSKPRGPVTPGSRTPGSKTPGSRSQTGGIPLGAQGYAPEHWWTLAEAEAKVQEFMRSGGVFGTKLPREAAERRALAFMRAGSIGIMSGTSSLGSWLLPKKEQDRILNKIDDVRYDLRLTGRRVGIAVGCLAGALGLLGVASIYRTQSLGAPARSFGQVRGGRYGK